MSCGSHLGVVGPDMGSLLCASSRHFVVVSFTLCRMNKLTREVLVFMGKMLERKKDHAVESEVLISCDPGQWQSMAVNRARR